jgi:hypothetical protein
MVKGAVATALAAWVVAVPVVPAALVVEVLALAVPAVEVVVRVLEGLVAPAVPVLVILANQPLALGALADRAVLVAVDRLDLVVLPNPAESCRHPYRIGWD